MHYSLFIGGFESALFGDYTGVIAVSLQGSDDPFAAAPPAPNQVYPLGLLSAGAGCKHQAWTFDSDRNEMIFGGGDTFTNSRPDFYAYNPATRQQTKIINAEDLGAEAYDRSIEYISISNGGSGYPPGGSMYYPNYTGLPAIPLIGGTGYGAACALHSSGGVIDSCTMHYSGYGYTVGDVLTVSNSYTGGTGSGFQITVTGVTAAGTPSTTISPDGRCLAGIAYDKTRHVMWLEGGGPRRTWASNLKKGGLWALDRNATPPTWYLQGPSVSECGLTATMTYNEYSTRLFYDEVGQALYTVYFNAVYKYSLAGVTIDGVYRNNWSAFNLPETVGAYNSYPAFDTLRRRIVMISLADSATYVWNCATDTLEELTPAFVPVWDNWWHADYDTETDRVICWTAASQTGWGEPGFVANDYIGKRIHWMYSMAPDGTWTQFTPAGDKLIQDNVHIAEMSGGYDPYHKCLVLLVGNQCYENYDIGDETVPRRMTFYHLYSPSGGPTITNGVWTPDRDGSGVVASGNWTGLPLNTWVEVAGGVLDDVIQNPRLLNYSGGDSSHGIVNAWSGMAWDYVNQIGYIDGGGHGDSSAIETGIYKVDVAKLQFTRVRDRDDASQLQCWDTVTHSFVAADLWPGGTNAPLVNGVPGSTHTYFGVIWIPPAVLGNTSGGVLPFGVANSIYNLDTGAWTTTNWFSPEEQYFDLSNCAAYIDGSKIYGPHAGFYHWRYDLTQNQATTWNSNSFGKFETGPISSTTQFYVGSAMWGHMRERREEFSFHSLGIKRVRYGQAIDANATDWSSYYDTITLTSSDGSHADFSAASFSDYDWFLYAGTVYDHSTATLYVQPNGSGRPAYKITGVAGNTWTTEAITGTACTRMATNGTFGRLQLATMAGKKILLRITGKDHPIQVMRIS